MGSGLGDAEAVMEMDGEMVGLIEAPDDAPINMSLGTTPRVIKDHIEADDTHPHTRGSSAHRQIQGRQTRWRCSQQRWPTRGCRCVMPNTSKAGP